MIRRSLIYLSTKLKSRINSGYIKGVKFLLKRYPKNRLAFTNSSSQKDGYGAQIQRILSVLALSNEFGRDFIFKPISGAEEQITQIPLSEPDKSQELNAVNDWLCSILEPYLSKFERDIRVYNAGSLFSLFAKLVLSYPLAYFLSNKLILEIEDAYPFTNLDPDMYDRLIFQTSDGGPQYISREFISIHIHLRFANFALDSERYLNPNYYFLALNEITSKLLDHGQTFRIYIHSDFDQTSQFSRADELKISTETMAYLANLKLINEDKMPNVEALRLANQTQKRFVDDYKDVYICRGQDLLASITEMIHADYLVLSKSSFAFVAGIMNSSGVIYSPEYWNNLPTRWVQLCDSAFSAP
jgi:hypothetical protein